MTVSVIAPESDDRDGRATVLDPELPRWNQDGATLLNSERCGRSPN